MTVAFYWKVVHRLGDEIESETVSNCYYDDYYIAYIDGLKEMDSQEVCDHPDYKVKLEIHCKSKYEGSKVNGKLWLVDNMQRNNWLKERFIAVVEKNKPIVDSIPEYLRRISDKPAWFNFFKNERYKGHSRFEKNSFLISRNTSLWINV